MNGISNFKSRCDEAFFCQIKIKAIVELLFLEMIEWKKKLNRFSWSFFRYILYQGEKKNVRKIEDNCVCNRLLFFFYVQFKWDTKFIHCNYRITAFSSKLIEFTLTTFESCLDHTSRRTDPIEKHTYKHNAHRDSDREKLYIYTHTIRAGIFICMRAYNFEI